MMVVLYGLHYDWVKCLNIQHLKVEREEKSIVHTE